VVHENVCFSASFIGTALACKATHLLRSLVSRHGRKKDVDLDDYDLNRLLTCDGRPWYTRAFVFSLVYRYRPCLQDGASLGVSCPDMDEKQTNVNCYHESWISDLDDPIRFLTGDGHLWYSRTYAFSFVYRYHSCLQDGASPAEPSVQTWTKKGRRSRR